jgi:ribonuclease D
LNPEVLNPLLQDPSKVRILQNAAYDMKLLKLNLGYYLTNVYDTMLAEQLLNLGLFSKASLDALVLKYLGLYMSKEPRDTFTSYHQTFQPFQ